MNRSHLHALGISIAAAALLSACDTVGPAIGIKPVASTSTSAPVHMGTKPASSSPSTAQPMPPLLSAEQMALRDGIELYNKGSYNDAIKRLTAPEVSGGSKATQLQALKYIAFSYCVSNRQTLCRQSFEKAFKLDPAFDLAPGEHGHPLWGPAFTRAKKGGK